MSDDGVMGSVLGAVLFVVGGLTKQYWLAAQGVITTDGMTSREVPE
jgi:hypothetical protein